VKIKVTIKPESAPAKVFEKYMAEKAAFRNAVQKSDVSKFTIKSGKRFDTPLSDNK